MGMIFSQIRLCREDDRLYRQPDNTLRFPQPDLTACPPAIHSFSSVEFFLNPHHVTPVAAIFGTLTT
jgi:hypothetical protein